MKPVRQVVKRTTHRSVGLLAPGRLDCAQVGHESYLEKQFIALAMMCLAIKQIHHQPFRLELVDEDGIAHRYVPDFLVTFIDDSKCVVEVKPKKFVEKNVLLFNAAKKRLDETGANFYVITDEHASKPRFDAIQLCRRYRLYTPPEAIASEALALVDRGIIWSEALSSGIPLTAWYSLLGQGVLLAENPDLLPNSPTRLYRSERETEHDCNIRFMHWFGCSPWTKDL